MKTRQAPAGRILMVEFFARGGLLHYSWQLAQGLARQAPGREVVLLTGRRPECPGGNGVRLRAELCTWDPQARPRGVPRRLLRAWRGICYVAAWMQVLRAAWRERPAAVLLGDLEHRCDAWCVAVLLRLGRRRGFRVGDVWHNVEAFERNHPGRLVRRPRWRTELARRLDVVFVHGEALAAQLERLSGVRPQVIRHGNQNWVAAQAGPDPGLEQRLRLPPGAVVALLFGTLSAYKGVEVLLEAMAELPEARRPLALVAGMPTAGVRPQAWRERARRLGLDPWLRWDERYVPTPEIAWYFRRADLVVLPYLAASQSGVAHLALTLGKPLIVSSAGSLAELIDGNGAVVAPGDAHGLAAALSWLASEPELRLQMGRRSAALGASRHSWDETARGVLAGLAPRSAESVAA